ncbi:MMPL family transporter [Eubacteriales bacterium OttesenSCG-928-K08]|nr:MMPL family transporter [Eubacteriales bacterium OttesenSCG-928-K08]
MDNFARGILRHRKTVIIIFLVLIVISAVCILGVSVNYNLVDYLPEDAQSTIALDIMTDEFSGAMPNARVMVRDVSVSEAAHIKEQLKSVYGVSEVLWLDDAADIKQPLETLDQAMVETYYKDGSALYSVAVGAADEKRSLEEIYALLGDKGAVTGDIVDTVTMQNAASSEVMGAMVLLVPIILIILLATTGSWFEPILFFAAIGTSVVLNMGSNLIFGEISFMTNSISPILQLAVSMDYAIFLLHNFEKNRQETPDVEEAMRLAVKRSLPVVAASSLTTLFGFLVLVAMKFKIGADLGLALSKGILLSLVSVMVFLPALTVSCHKLIDKTKHRSLLPSFSKASRLVVRARVPVMIIVLALIVPAYLAQGANTFTYGNGVMEAGSRSGMDQAEIEERFGSSTAIVLLVPRGDVAREALLASALEDVPRITSVISYASLVGAEIPDAFLSTDVTSQFYSENYARLVLYANTPSEGELAFSVVEQVRSLASNFYGEAALSCGQSANLYDMKQVVTADNALVSILAVIAIGLVILFVYKSLSLPIILVLTIETAIWINLSTPYFSGMALNYIGYLVINTVQLGATVDYAILYSDHYIDNRSRLPKLDAAINAAKETMGSILVSGGILSITGFMLSFSSSIEIVSGLGQLLGRGTILSMLMVFLFLPALLTLFDRVVEKTTWHAKFLPAKGEGKQSIGSDQP